MQLDLLVSQIQNIDGSLKAEANKAVNRLLTIRNWLIGYYIVVYEQKGEDRAKYGENLLDILSSSLNIKGLSVTNLKLNRLFYITYPQIGQTLPDQVKKTFMDIRQTVSDEYESIDNQVVNEETRKDELESFIKRELKNL